MIKSICTGVLLVVFGLASTAGFACNCVEDTGSCGCKSQGDKAPTRDGGTPADKSGQ